MATADFPSNNPKGGVPPQGEPRADRPKVRQVTASRVTQRKPSIGSRLRETMGGEDARSVGSHLLLEVIIPSIKAMLADSASQGVDRLLFGEVRRRPSGVRSSSSGTNYTSYGTRGRAMQPDEPTRTLSRQARATHNFAEIVIDDFGEANQVLDDLQAIIDQYDVASISTMYDMVGVTGNHIDDKWGWTDLQGARVDRLNGGGYLLNLPKPVPLD